jgi:gas vesicle protein
MANEYDYEGGGGSGFMMGLLTGTVLGAGLGMLFAPKSGSELRGQLSESASSVGRAASEQYQKVAGVASEMAGRGRDVVGRARNAVSRGAEEVRRHTSEPLRPGGNPPGSGGSTGPSGPAPSGGPMADIYPSGSNR